MSADLQERLNQILPRIISDDFLSGAGIGNEIAFYIFDYPPEDELAVREHVRFLLEHIPKAKPRLRVKHVNLFDFVLDYLRGRNLLDRSLQMQREKGDEALKKALRARSTRTSSPRFSSRRLDRRRTTSCSSQALAAFTRSCGRTPCSTTSTRSWARRRS